MAKTLESAAASVARSLAGSRQIQRCLTAIEPRNLGSVAAKPDDRAGLGLYDSRLHRCDKATSVRWITTVWDTRRAASCRCCQARHRSQTRSGFHSRSEMNPSGFPGVLAARTAANPDILPARDRSRSRAFRCRGFPSWYRFRLSPKSWLLLPGDKVQRLHSGCAVSTVDGGS